MRTRDICKMDVKGIIRGASHCEVYSPCPNREPGQDRKPDKCDENRAQTEYDRVNGLLCKLAEKEDDGEMCGHVLGIHYWATGMSKRCRDGG